LDAIRGTVFGVDRSPTVEEKACALAYAVIHGHVFVDGNKRTGTEILYQMLELNGRTIVATDDEIVGIIESVGSGQLGVDVLVSWVRARLR
jgi:death-on-curing protein